MLVTTHPSFQAYLRKLSLHSCNYFVMPLCTLYAQQLEELDLSCENEVLKQLGTLAFPKMKKLVLEANISKLPEETFGAVATVLQQCPQLQHLEFHDSGYYSPSTIAIKLLVEVLECKMDTLKQISLRGCKHYGAGWKELVENDAITSRMYKVHLSLDTHATEMLQFLSKCTQLHELELRIDYSYKLTLEHAKQVIAVMPMLKHLKKIKLHSFEFTDLDTEKAFFANLPTSIEDIDFWDGKLRAFPGIQHLVHCKVLSFHSLSLPFGIPSWLQDMSALQTFYTWVYEVNQYEGFALNNPFPSNLSSCYLTKTIGKLEPSAFQRAKIKTLNIEKSSDITHLSNELLDVLAPYLTDIRLEHNKNLVIKKDFPIAKLKKLVTLSLEELTLTVPQQVSQLVDLNYVKFKTCNLKAFPVEILTLQHVKYLQLDNNSITSIPDMLMHGKALPNLEQLHINNNLLDHIPDFSKHTRLKFIAMRNNPILKNHKLSSEEELQLYDLEESIKKHITQARNPMHIPHFDAKHNFAGKVAPKECHIQYVIPLHNKYLIGFWLELQTFYTATSSGSTSHRFYMFSVRTLNTTDVSSVAVEMHEDYYAGDDEFTKDIPSESGKKKTPTLHVNTRRKNSKDAPEPLAKKPETSHSKCIVS